MAYAFTTVNFTPADTPPFTELLGINDAGNEVDYSSDMKNGLTDQLA